MDNHRSFFTRKSPRADFHDYSGGVYFITICTLEKANYFGSIADNKMTLSEIGRVADDNLASLPQHYPYVEVPLYVVMPNHLHAIIVIKADGMYKDKIPAERTALGVVVGGFKQAVTRYARRNNIEFAWQSRYHDHIIRGREDANNIDEYIRNNVARWASDCFYK